MDGITGLQLEQCPQDPVETIGVLYTGQWWTGVAWWFPQFWCICVISLADRATVPERLGVMRQKRTAKTVARAKGPDLASSVGTSMVSATVAAEALNR